MSEANYLLEEPGRRVMLLGNQAIARGLLEGGLQAAAAYPGTPSTEVMETVIQMGGKFGFYTEWSTNEKVASEVAISASMSGLRAMVSMKGVGANVASEPFQAFTYMGVEGGLVMVCADDPSVHSSHTEQDNRYLAREAYIPVLEPSDVREAKEMARLALGWSEKWGQPVMLRSNTVLSHTRSDVLLKRVARRKTKGIFVRQPKRWVNLPMNARVLRRRMVERMEAIALAAERLPFTRVEGNRRAPLGIITSGISYVYVLEALELLGAADSVKLLKLGMPYPLPRKKLANFLKGLERVLVVEELEPFVETEVASLANKLGCRTKIEGKAHGEQSVPITGELTPGRVVKVLADYLGLKQPASLAKAARLEEKAGKLAPPRPPVLCPGCPERNGFYAMNLVERKLKRKLGAFVRPTDIGCYTIGYMPPLSAADINLCMGAGLGVSTGFAHFVDNPVVATIGDSTFFHAGMPALVNAVFNNADLTLLVFDNGTTAMTGHQPHPGAGRKAGNQPAPAIDIAGVCKAFGVGYVKVVSGFDMDATVEALQGAVEYQGPAVVIARAPCQLERLRELRAQGQPAPLFQVDEEKCKQCGLCITHYGCPAMYWQGEEIKIDPLLCGGCGACSSEQVCHLDAIHEADREALRADKGRPS